MPQRPSDRADDLPNPAPRRARGGARVALLALLAVALGGVRCTPSLRLLPPLLASDPVPGATGVVHSQWLILDFAAPLQPGAEENIFLVCEGVSVPLETSLLSASSVVANPAGLLPASAACSLGLETTSGVEYVSFQTAATGSPFAGVYDRRDRNLPLPFPDDYYLDPDPTTPTGLRPNITVPNHSVSVEGLLGAMASVGAAGGDGWSPIGNLNVQLSAAPDPASLPLDQEASLDPLASVGLFDLTPGSPTYGQRIPFKLTIRSDAVGAQPLSHCLVLFPGIPLTPTGRYALAVTNRVLSGGEPLAASSFFAELRGPLGPGADPEVVKAHPLAQEVMAALESLPVPIPRDDLALAVRLTARSTDHFPDDVLAMREDVLDQDLNVQITNVSPSFGDVAAIVTGTFDAPTWRIGGFVARDAGGVPMTIGTKTIPFILALPDAAETTGMAPIVMYQHGNPGSAEGEVPGAAADFLAGAGFAVGGFTDVLNRTYSDVAEQQLAIFGLVLAVGDVADFYLQTYAEQMTFLRVLQSLDSLDVLPLGAPDGVADLDPSAITYEGISYGSNHGQAFLAYAPDILGAGLVVGAVRLTELLEYQDRTRPAGGPSFLFELLPSFVAGATPPDVWMGLSLFSLVYDRQDPHNHARFLYTDPINVGGSTKKASILVLEGIQDSFTSNNSTRSLAWLLGPIPHVGTPPVPVSYLPEQSGPIQANVDSETTAAWAQFVPAGIPGVPATPGCAFQFEGHFCAQTAPSARSLRSDFYTSAASGSGAPVIGP